MTILYRAGQALRALYADGLTKRSFSLLLFALVVLLCCCDWHSLYGPIDFAAFRCAGEALRLHLDPYLTTSLRGCEQHLAPFYHPLLADVTLSAPFPAYSLAFFSLFTGGQPLFVFAIWSCIQIGASVLTVVLLHRLLSLSPTLIALVMIVQMVLIALPLGQIVPLIMAAICVVLYGVKYDKPLLATAAAVFSMLEPHIGLPTCVALFLVERRSRLALIIGAFLLCFVWYEALPLHTNLEYLRNLLPDQGVSEAFDDEQYSLTHVLVYFGFQPVKALFWGSLSYLTMLLLGAIGAISISTWKKDKGSAIVFAPTIGLLAGPYVHVNQMAIALIAALYAYSSSTKSRDVIALIILALPLASIRTPIDMLIWLVLGVALPYLLYRKTDDRRASATALGALTAIAMASLVFQWSQRGVIRDPGFHQRALAYLAQHQALFPASAQFADSQWQTLVTQQLTSLGWIALVAHLLMWLALVSVLISLCSSRVSAAAST